MCICCCLPMTHRTRLHFTAHKCLPSLHSRGKRMMNRNQEMASKMELCMRRCVYVVCMFKRGNEVFCCAIYTVSLSIVVVISKYLYANKNDIDNFTNMHYSVVHPKESESLFCKLSLFILMSSQKLCEKKHWVGRKKQVCSCIPSKAISTYTTVCVSVMFISGTKQGWTVFV